LRLLIYVLELTSVLPAGLLTRLFNTTWVAPLLLILVLNPSFEVSSLPIPKSTNDPRVSVDDVIISHSGRITLTVPEVITVGANQPFAGVGMMLGIDEWLPPVVWDKGAVEFVFRQASIKNLMEKTGVVKEVLGFCMLNYGILQIICLCEFSPLRFSRYLRSPLQVVIKSGDVSNRHKKTRSSFCQIGLQDPLFS